LKLVRRILTAVVRRAAVQTAETPPETVVAVGERCTGES
jgi:hypothetical protein